MKLRAKLAELERVIEELRETCAKAEGGLGQAQGELTETRARTAAAIAAAEDRLHWMDRYHLGPETFEKRLYMRLLVRGLSGLRRLAGLVRKLRDS